MNDDKYKMITYDELYNILWDKYRATDDELSYWIKLSHPESNLMFPKNLTPFDSDIFRFNPSSSYRISLNNFHFPKLRFYKLSEVDEFVPNPCLRFVYQNDLFSRGYWNRETYAQHLKKANEWGILRFYDQDRHEFYLHKIWKPKLFISSADTYSADTYSADSYQELWCNASDIDQIISNPDTFFTIYDILTIERVLFGRDLNSCLDELYGKDRKKTDDD